MKRREPTLFLAVIVCLVASLAAPSDASAQQEEDAPEAVPEVVPAPPTTDQRIAKIEADLKARPNDPALLANLAQEFVQKYRETADGSYIGRAEAACGKALQQDPEHYATQRLLPGIYNIQHRFAEAAALARKNAERNRNDAVSQARLGDALLELGQYDEAEEIYLLLSFRAPKSTSLPRLARLAELKGEPDAAAEHYQAAIVRAADTHYPEHLAWLHVQLGNLYFGQGKYAEAEQQHQQALGAFANYHLALSGLAQVRVAQQRFDEAVELYRKSTAVAPLYEPVVALADLYAHLGKQKEAVQQFKLLEVVEKLNRAHNVRPDSPAVLFMLDHDRDVEEALKLAQAQAKERQDIRTLDALAWALYKNKEYPEALEASRKALRLDTRDATLHFHRGMILAKLNQKQQAVAALRKALEINPCFHLKHAAEARATLTALESQ